MTNFIKKTKTYFRILFLYSKIYIPRLIGPKADRKYSRLMLVSAIFNCGFSALVAEEAKDCFCVWYDKNDKK